jgi:GPH family glycoside/pentoside/hexuronide:cation symporter
MTIAIRKQAAYGCGGIVYAVKEAAYAAFVLLFYTQVLGLSGTITGVVLFLSLMWDAVSDPLVGTWSDRHRSRWGRRHPFMVASVFPLGIGFVGLFSPPEIVTETPLLLAGWLLFWSLWIRTAVTLFALPHIAMSAEMTGDYHERSQLMGTRIGLMFVTSVMFPALAIAGLFGEVDGEDGRFIAANYPLYGWWSAVLVWVAGSITIVGTRWIIHEERQGIGEPPDGRGLRSLVEDFLLTLRNLNFRNLLFYDLAASASYGITVALTILAFTFYWELSATQMALLLGTPAITAVPLAVLTIRPIGRRWPKHLILTRSIFYMLLNSAWLYPLRMLDLLPENGHPLVMILLSVQMFLFIYLFVLRVVAASSIIADVTDEHDVEHGKRQEGGFFSAFAFTTKLASAAGPLYGGIALDVIGLHEGMQPGQVPEATLDGLAWAMLVAVLPLMAIAWYFTLKVSMTQQRLLEIQRQLAARAG